MLMDLSPDLDALVHFFGCQPALKDESLPWPENQLMFEIQNGSDRVECVIFPSDSEFSFCWQQVGREAVVFHSKLVAGLSLAKLDGGETLKVGFGDQVIGALWIRLRPKIHVAWSTEDF